MGAWNEGKAGHRNERGIMCVCGVHKLHGKEGGIEFENLII
jgi:hypothetical protein